MESASIKEIVSYAIRLVTNCADITAGELSLRDTITSTITGSGLVLVPREIVANYANSTHIPRHRRICEAALATVQNETPSSGETGVSGAEMSPVVDSDDEAQTRHGIGLRWGANR